VKQGESPQRALTEEQQRGRAKDPSPLSLHQKMSFVFQNLFASSQTPLRVFVRWLLRCSFSKKENPATFLAQGIL
jgi:hypothetical protein